MTDETPIASHLADEKTSASDLLIALGDLMRDCYRESLDLQDAIAAEAPDIDRRSSNLETFQHIDHVTQVHDDLARLLPVLARAMQDGSETVDHLSSELRLISLRERLFRSYPKTDAAAKISGDVNLF